MAVEQQSSSWWKLSQGLHWDCFPPHRQRLASAAHTPSLGWALLHVGMVCWSFLTAWYVLLPGSGERWPSGGSAQQSFGLVARNIAVCSRYQCGSICSQLPRVLPCPCPCWRHNHPVAVLGALALVGWGQHGPTCEGVGAWLPRSPGVLSLVLVMVVKQRHGK